MDKVICGAFYYNYLQAGTAAPTPQTGDWLPCQRRARPLPFFQTDKGAPPPSSFIIHPSSFPKVPPPTTPVSPCIGVQNLSPTPVLECLHRVTPILKETAEPSLSDPQSASTQPPAVARTPAAPWKARSSSSSASLPACPAIAQQRRTSPSPPAPSPGASPARTPQPSTLSHQPSQWRPKSDLPGASRRYFCSRTRPTHPYSHAMPWPRPLHEPKGSSLSRPATPKFSCILLRMVASLRDLTSWTAQVQL
jgi:hypothetical protein